jgi:soluble lytic murein transglycosylase-like protein
VPLRAATSPRVTLNAAAQQWAVAAVASRPSVMPRPAAPVAPVAPVLASAAARRWTPLINEMAQREGLDPALAHAVIAAESAYHPAARSPKGAVGLMQLMPATAERFGTPRAQRHDPEANLRAGLRYLKWLIAHFDGDLRLALAGYHAGEGAVQKYGNRIPPYPETQNYVRKVKGYLAQ